MRYVVEWTRTARNRQLAAIWLAAKNRNAVTAATHEIDSLLEFDPSSKGESRSGSHRILIVEPLAVVFKVLETQKRVRVFSVRPYGSPS